MILIDGAIKDGVMNAQEQALTGEQLTVIHQEFETDPTGRGYFGMTLKGKRDTLCKPYDAPNPTPQGRVSNGYVTGLRVMMMGTEVEYLGATIPLKMKFELMAESSDLADKIKGKSVLEVCNWDSVNTADPRIIAKFESFVDDGLLPREFVDYVLYKPDPDWPEFVHHPSRLYELLGLDGVVLVSELE